jgi:hypothetical protein
MNQFSSIPQKKEKKREKSKQMRQEEKSEKKRKYLEKSFRILFFAVSGPIDKTAFIE